MVDTLRFEVRINATIYHHCKKQLNFQARHHLAAATQILLEYHQDMLKPGMTDDEKKAADENFNHRLADVNRCWVKYALNLMSDSRDRLIQDSEEAGKWNSCDYFCVMCIINWLSEL